jgi:hypothetical protein
VSEFNHECITFLKGVTNVKKTERIIKIYETIKKNLHKEGKKKRDETVQSNGCTCRS